MKEYIASTAFHIPSWGWLACAFGENGLALTKLFFDNQAQAHTALVAEISELLPQRVLMTAKQKDIAYWHEVFLSFFAGGDTARNPDIIPLDNRHWTPFRRKVYLTLRQTVKWGEQISYGDLALRAGHPGAARAVGSAMAQNRHSPFIPCHRVLGAQETPRRLFRPGWLNTETAPLGFRKTISLSMTKLNLTTQFKQIETLNYSAYPSIDQPSHVLVTP